jgi:hypothetical protein
MSEQIRTLAADLLRARERGNFVSHPAVVACHSASIIGCTVFFFAALGTSRVEVFKDVMEDATLI